MKRPVMLDSRPRFLVVAFALTVFLSAFLLFQVQPLLSKAILPWFGGTPAVWTTCMLFFQTLLFGGYAYAHLLARRLSPKSQMLLHTVLLIAAACTLPISPAAEWKPNGSEDPITRILLVLGVSVGLPFFVLSSTGPLLQSWFARSVPGSSPYRLYALSNAGSLLALVSYPFVFEPALDIGEQSILWSIGFGLFALLCAWCAYQTPKSHGQRLEAEEHRAVLTESLQDTDTAVTPMVVVLWFLLAMAGSMLLLSTTNQVCLDVASIPFLWVLPLALYLLTFILCFDSDFWYSRYWALPAMAGSIAAMCWMISEGAGDSLPEEISYYFGGMFCCVMVCHGELVRLKPPPKHLTAFYLVISAGGAAGGLFIGVVAPMIFPIYLELQVSLCLTAFLATFVVFREESWLWRLGKPYWAAVLAVVIGGLFFQCRFLYADALVDLSRIVDVSRNFYGVLRVREYDADNKQRHRWSLSHGRIQHGMQFASKEKRRWPTTYYGHDSAVGLVLENPRKADPKYVGVVGLGVGTIATYAKPGDRFRFYEINPDVVRLAQRHFYYLRECRGKTQVVVGDARLMLEREKPQQFDVLILDAFSSDAIPAHLLTTEAFRVYARHVKPDGALLVHISNRYFNLLPVVVSAAEKIEFQGRKVDSWSDSGKGTNAATWIVLSRRLSYPAYTTVRKHGDKFPDERIEWTDTFSNLLHVLK